ncbi:MAG: sodium:proton antiporter [Lachnospiraceae bacterium]|nr:sodium:proton antiporter [Lachnospiraceae bacterium]
MSFMLGFTVFFPMISAVVCYATGKKKKEIRDYLADAVTGIEFIVFLMLLIWVIRNNRSITLNIPEACGMGLCFTLDGFRALYGSIAGFMWLVSTLFSREYLRTYRNRNRYYFFLLITLGAVAGIFLSADFYTTFIFFEVMSFTSYVWVAQDEKKESLRAAQTYLGIAVIGGLVMLMGIFLLYQTTGTLKFEELIGCYENYVQLSSSGIPERKVLAAGICMLAGFGAKAGAFPLHVWLPKAHPAAPAPASALLSGVLTKTGIFGVLLLTLYLFAGSIGWGTLILLLGVCTMVIGAVLALFSINLKRTLACSSVSQIGFILVGIGMAGLLGAENGLALRGSLLHMVNHSLIKLTLFLAAGVIYMNIHRLNLNEIQGYGRKKPLLHYIFLMGALGIGGIPLWNGYVSKTLIHEAILEYTALLADGAESLLSLPMLKGVEWSFLISGGLTIAYMAKLYVAIFIEKNKDAAVQEKFDSEKGDYMNPVSSIALTVSATLLPLMGFLPGQVMNRIANLGRGFLLMEQEAQSVSWFSPENLKGAFISIGIGAVIYLVLVRLWMRKKEDGSVVYVDRWYPYLDLENLIYRPVLLQVLPFLLGIVCRAMDSFVDAVVVLLRKTIYKDSKLPRELEEGTAITYAAGGFVNSLEQAANATIWRKKPKKTDYRHKYALIYQEWSEDSTLIGRSLSFGLLLFCAGLILTVIYLLL